MRFILWIAILLSQHVAPAQDCGVSRQSVKVGADSDASRVNQEAKDVDIEQLAEQPVSTSAREKAFMNKRMGREGHGPEWQRFRVTAKVVGWKKEKDGDYHIVIKQGRLTMNIEIVNPPCANGSPWRDAIEEASDSFASWRQRHPKKHLGENPDEDWVTVEGIGFFDLHHRGNPADGMLPNTLELHPVLSFKRARR